MHQCPRTHDVLSSTWRDRAEVLAGQQRGRKGGGVKFSIPEHYSTNKSPYIHASGLEAMGTNGRPLALTLVSTSPGNPDTSDGDDECRTGPANICLLDALAHLRTLIQDYTALPQAPLEAATNVWVGNLIFRATKGESAIWARLSEALDARLKCVAKAKEYVVTHGAKWPDSWRPLTKTEQDTSDRYERRLRAYIVKTPFKTTWTFPREMVVIALEEAGVAPHSRFGLMIEKGRQRVRTTGYTYSGSS